MFSRPMILLLLIAGCATKPTPYQKEKKKEGYNDQGFEDIKVATFRANTKTKKERAQLYAEFRAIENCIGTDRPHANMIDIFDKTVEKEITRTSGSSWGPTYFGMYPYYSRYSSFGISAGFDTISADSWRETIRYPVIEVYYTCANRVYRPQIVFRELNADDMKHLVKDIKGAIQVEKIQKDSPNQDLVKIGDIILKVNGKRIEKVYELIRLFDEKDKEVKVDILREGEKVASRLRSVDITEEVIKTEKNIITEVCKTKDEKRQEELKSRKLCQ